MSRRNAQLQGVQGPSAGKPRPGTEMIMNLNLGVHPEGIINYNGLSA